MSLLHMSCSLVMDFNVVLLGQPITFFTRLALSSFLISSLVKYDFLPLTVCTVVQSLTVFLDLLELSEPTA